MQSPTATAAQKHLESHKGIQGFRCTICGYRGNTLRGMRTHIRIHFEKRSNDIHEENFIDCIIDNCDQKKNRGASGASISMPNKNSIQVQQQKVLMENPLLASAVVSGVVPPNQAKAADQPFSCHMCSFVTPYNTTFIQHLAIAHKLGPELKTLLEKQLENSQFNVREPESSSSQAADADASDSSSPPARSVKLEPEVKLEVTDSDEDLGNLSNNHHSQSPVTSPVGNQNSLTCHSCQISFTLFDSFMAHKRFYCSRQQSSTSPETSVQ